MTCNLGLREYLCSLLHLAAVGAAELVSLTGGNLKVRLPDALPVATVGSIPNAPCRQREIPNLMQRHDSSPYHFISRPSPRGRLRWHLARDGAPPGPPPRGAPLRLRLLRRAPRRRLPGAAGLPRGRAARDASDRRVRRAQGRGPGRARRRLGRGRPEAGARGHRVRRGQGCGALGARGPAQDWRASVARQEPRHGTLAVLQRGFGFVLL